jgi:putative transposase
MPRLPRIILPDVPHHVTQRGNYRQKVFYCDQDRKLYLELLKRYSRSYGVSIQAYCLMGNHVHLIVTPHDKTGLARLFQRLHSEYARGLHERIGRVGHLWQARYASAAMDEQHLWQAMVYVEQNPVRAGLVESAEQWRWSSARAHLRGEDGGWLDLVGWRRRFDGKTWKRCLQLGLADAMLLERIRESTRFGWPLAADAFLDGLEQRHGLRLRPARRGRRPSATTHNITTTYRPSVVAAAG